MSSPQPEAGGFRTPQNCTFYATHLYANLDSSNREVRLLTVLPNCGAGLVDCELLREKALTTVQGTYFALSYCAGDPANARSIIINGINFQAFSNLAHALTIWKTRSVWEDRSTRF